MSVLNEVYEKKIDWFISPKEALELKIVDEIIQSDSEGYLCVKKS